MNHPYTTNIDPDDEPIQLDSDTLLNLRHELNRQKNSADRISSTHPGIRLSRRRGNGFEFEDLRTYIFGDDPRHIDWNVAARTGELYTRLYRHEHERTTSAAVDLRSSMFTGTSHLKARRACLAAARILWAAAHVGDKTGVIVFTDDALHTSEPARAAMGVQKACELINAIYNRQRAYLEQHSASPTGQFKQISRSLNDRKWQKQQHQAFVDTGRWITSAGRRPGVIFLITSGDYIWPTETRDASANILNTAQPCRWIVLNDVLEHGQLTPGKFTLRIGWTPQHNKQPLQPQTAEDMIHIQSGDLDSLTGHLATAHRVRYQRFLATGQPFVLLNDHTDDRHLIELLIREQLT